MLLKANPAAGSAFCQYLVSSYTDASFGYQGFRWISAGLLELRLGRRLGADEPNVYPSLTSTRASVPILP